MKYELCGKVMINFVGFRAKTYSYLIDNGSEDKRAKDIKKELKFENYKNCLEATQIKSKTNHLEKSKINLDLYLFHMLMFVPYAYVFIKSIDCILLSSIEL